jgi:non-ribosomal peptide synthetase component F
MHEPQNNEVGNAFEAVQRSTCAYIGLVVCSESDHAGLIVRREYILRMAGPKSVVQEHPLAAREDTEQKLTVVL